MVRDTSGSAGQISPGQRQEFAALADEMIPAARGMPSATGADAHGAWLDAVLRSRPDLVEPLRDALDQLAAARAGGSALATISSPGHERAWGLLATVVPAAYFLNPEVRRAVGYPGQGAIPVDRQPSDIDPELLESVRARPAVYRPTPVD